MKGWHAISWYLCTELNVSFAGNAGDYGPPVLNCCPISVDLRNGLNVKTLAIAKAIDIIMH